MTHQTKRKYASRAPVAEPWAVELRRIDDDVRRLEAQLEVARRRRAVAVRYAHRSGKVSTRLLGDQLGVSHVRVIELIRAADAGDATNAD
jgi:hypothetical protein